MKTNEALDPLLVEKVSVTIKLEPDLEIAVLEAARRRGVTPESIIENALRECLRLTVAPVPRDEWEQRLFEIASDCGVSLPPSAVSSDAIYE